MHNDNVYGSFRDIRRARQCLNELRAAGFPAEDMLLVTERDTPPPRGEDDGAPAIAIAHHFEQPDLGNTVEEYRSAVMSGLLDGAAVGLFLGLVEMLAYQFTTLGLAATLGIAALVTVVSMAVGIALRVHRVGGTPPDVIEHYGEIVHLGGATVRLTVHSHYDVDAAAVLMSQCGAHEVRSFRARGREHPLSVPNYNKDESLVARM